MRLSVRVVMQGLNRLRKKGNKTEEIDPNTLDFSKKVLHLAFHPHENTAAVAAANNLFIYHAS